jgi:PAS domain-containing protein
VDPGLVARPVGLPRPGELFPLLASLHQGEPGGPERDFLAGRYRAALAGGRPLSFQLELQHGGDLRAVECHLLPEQGGDGTVTGVLGLFTDVTDESRQRLESEARSQRFLAVIGHMPGFCYTVDRNLVFTSSVGAGLGSLELAEGQVIGMRLAELWGTSDPSYEPYACHLRALTGERQTYATFAWGARSSTSSNPSGTARAPSSA